MSLRPSVSQARVGVLVLNLALTLTLCGHAAHRLVLNRDDREHDGRLEKRLGLDPEVFRPRPAIAGEPGPDRKVPGEWFLQSSPASPPTYRDEVGETKPEPIDEVGPLEGRWEYVSFILFPARPEMNLAVLRRSADGPRGGTRIRRPKSRTSRNPAARNPSGDVRVVRRYDRWTLDAKGRPDEVEQVVWIVRVSEDEIVYERAGSTRQYHMPRKVRPIYPERPSPEASDDEPTFFYRDGEMPDPAEAFEKRHSSSEGEQESDRVDAKHDQDRPRRPDR